MKVNWERTENNTVQMHVEVPAERVEEALQKAYRKVVKNVSLPGFRKGKVPRQILEMRFGPEILYEDAVDILLPQAYSEAVEQSGIEPVDRPNITDLKIEKGAPLTFTAEVTVKPEVELGKYKDIEAEKPVFKVTEKDVDDYLERLRQSHARIEVSPDETVSEGDFVTIDFEGCIDGEPFEGGKAENYELEIGSKTFIPGFEEQILGMQRGEEKEIEVTFPEDYRAEHLAGKKATFKVKVHEIKRRVVPEIDEDFVKEVSEFDTVEELRQDAENKLKQAVEEQSEQYLRNNVVRAVVSNASVDIPTVMIDDEVDRLIREREQNLMYSGISLQQYLELVGKTLDDLRADLRPVAEEDVKTDLVLSKLAEEEEIEVSDEEFDARLEELAKNQNQPVEFFRKLLEVRGTGETLRQAFRKDKVVDFLVENCQIKLVEPEDQQEEEEQGEGEQVKEGEENSTKC